MTVAHRQEAMVKRKLKRHKGPQPVHSDLADIFQEMLDLLVRNMANGSLTQAAVALSGERRQQSTAASASVPRIGVTRG
jgi:N12 class adenine-specific DNA methylase